MKYLLSSEFWSHQNAYVEIDFIYFMSFTLHKLKCDNGHYTNTVVAEGETLEENLKKFTLRSMCKSCCLPLHKC